MSRVLAVAIREFKQTVLRKVFLLAILGIPVLMVGAFVLMAVVLKGHKQPPLVGSIAVVDATGDVAEAAMVVFDPQRISADRQREAEKAQRVAEEMVGAPMPSTGTSPADLVASRGAVEVTIEGHSGASEAEIEALRDRVRNGELLAAAVVPESAIDLPDPADDAEPASFELLVAEHLDVDHSAFIGRRLGEAVIRVRAERAGLVPEMAMAMLQRPEADTRRAHKGGEETDDTLAGLRAKIVPMVFMMLIWIGVFSSAQHLMMSTIEEKSNRVMEVLLSAVSPMQLMTGKILGHGAVGLLIVLVHSSLGLLALGAMALMSMIRPMDIVYLFVFFFMAYFMIAALMAAVGSAVSDIREANTLITPVMIVVIVPLMLWPLISEDPNGGIATLFSFIPPATPFVMIVRLVADEPVPLWQIPTSIVWGGVCVVGMVWMAAKIFRVGVLMYGKPPTPVQLLKWLRYA